ncbi:MAG: BspA family leucine-rich repeat surface protein, partial [Flavicella sp.]|nr:BspA family leucine-rich repeat surface protein [Flavicella sp.]
NWNVSNVEDMGYMFAGVSSFNQDISGWNISNVTNMEGMFRFNEDFNQNIGSWDVSNVEDMGYMFSDASSFNQDISNWCVTNIVSKPSNFSDNSPLSESNMPAWGTCPSLGIDDQYLTNISIYPNPTNDKLFIQGLSDATEVSIYNILGKDVISTNNASNINVKALPSGVYVIRISDGVHQTNRTFLKN